MAKRTYQEIIAQKDFYRGAYRRFTSLLMFSVFLMLFFMAGTIYLVITEPDPAYYASQSAGILTPIKPINEPNPTGEALLPPDPIEEMKATRTLTI